MRYIMKGGVWKNSEDQILKAAIMKYGLNQWSRISSLLQRKAAKQCKQRWYEWLDPSIKKTEWTRAEDEKLLQLSRVFPSQWRTIAPFVGRTPTQCYERYEKLLDTVQGKSIHEAQNLKKLRPGEIDPNPETKPARLDPIDMDEDQKEMLAEVRVRLANTKGKKAKRKQREKIIEEARRLAQLQKVRELQMAGVDNIPTAKEIKRMKQRRDINYNKQIPFKRDVPQFVYKLEESEAHKGEQFAETMTIQKLQGKRRDVEEQLQKKLDKRRMKKFRQRDLKTVLKLKNDFEKPAAFAIQLPDPQITEKDLQNMKRFNITTPLNSEVMSNMNQTPFGKTPQNKIMLAAQVNMSLNHQQMTPFAENKIDGVEGLNYLKQLEKGVPRQGNRSIDRVISEHAKTPANGWQDEQKSLKKMFKNLKRPQNMIEFQIPEEIEQSEQQVILDAQEVEQLENQKLHLLQLERQQQNTKVIKRKLRRPMMIPNELNPKPVNEIDRLVSEEVLSLLYSDGIDYPVQNMQFPENPVPYRRKFNLQAIETSKKLVSEQLENNQYDHINEEQLGCTYKRIKLNFKGKSAQINQCQLTKQEILVNQIQKYNINVPYYKNMLKKANNNEKKIRKLHAGYHKIINTIIMQINQKEAELQGLKIEKNVLQQLRNKEFQNKSIRTYQLEEYYKLIYNSL